MDQVPAVTGPVRETSETPEDGPPGGSPGPGPGPGRTPERDRGGDPGRVADAPDLETEDWKLQNNLGHRNIPESQTRIPEELMGNPDSTRENHHLTPERLQIIL